MVERGFLEEIFKFPQRLGKDRWEWLDLPFQFDPTPEERAQGDAIEKEIEELEQEVKLATTTQEITSLRDKISEKDRELESLERSIYQRLRVDATKTPWQEPENQKELASQMETDIEVFTSTLIRDAQAFKQEPLTEAEIADITVIGEAVGSGNINARFRAGSQSKQPWLRDWGSRDRTVFPAYQGIQTTVLRGKLTYFLPTEGVPGVIPPQKMADVGRVPDVVAELEDRRTQAIQAGAPDQVIRDLDAQIKDEKQLGGQPVVLEDQTIPDSELDATGERVIRQVLAVQFDKPADSFSNAEVSAFWNIHNQRLSILPTRDTTSSESDRMSPKNQLSLLFAVYEIEPPAVLGIGQDVQEFKDTTDININQFRDDVIEGFQGENGRMVTGVNATFEETFGRSLPMLDAPTMASVEAAIIGAYQAINALPAEITPQIEQFIQRQADTIMRNAKYASVVDGQIDIPLFNENIQAAVQQQAQALGTGGVREAMRQEREKAYLASLPVSVQFEEATGITLKTGKETRTEQDIMNEQAYREFQNQINEAQLMGEEPNVAAIARRALAQATGQMEGLRGEDLPQVTDEQRQQIMAGQGGYQPVPAQALSGPIGGMFANLWNQYEKKKHASIVDHIEKAAEEGEYISYEEAEEALFPDPVAPEPSRFDKEEAAVKERGRQDAIDEYIRINTPDRGVTEEEALRPFQRWDEEEERYVPTERPEGESDASWNRRRDEALETVTQPDPSQVAPTEAEAEKALSGMNIFKEDYTMPGFGEPEPDIVPTTPPPPGLAGTTRRRRRAIT